MENPNERPVKLNSTFQEFMANGFPLVFYIFFPGLIVGIYYSIPLGIIAALLGFTFFMLHCDLLAIRRYLEDIDRKLRVKR